MKYTETSEMKRLKQQLEAANSKIAKMDEELCQNRITKHTFDQAMGSASEYDFPLTHKNDAARFPPVVSSFNQARPDSRGNDTWNGQDDTNSDNSDPYPIGTVTLRGGHGTWAHNGRTSFGAPSSGLISAPDSTMSLSNTTWNPARTFVAPVSGPTVNTHGLAGYQSSMRAVPPPPLPLDGSRGNGVYFNEQANFQTDRRVPQPPSRPTSAMDPRFANVGYVPSYNNNANTDGHGPTPPLTPLTPMFPYQSANLYTAAGLFQPGNGSSASRLSPTAAEFNLKGGYGPRNDPWNAHV